MATGTSRHRFRSRLSRRRSGANHRLPHAQRAGDHQSRHWPHRARRDRRPVSVGGPVFRHRRFARLPCGESPSVEASRRPLGRNRGTCPVGRQRRPAHQPRPDPAGDPCEPSRDVWPRLGRHGYVRQFEQAFHVDGRRHPPVSAAPNRARRPHQATSKSSTMSFTINRSSNRCKPPARMPIFAFATRSTIKRRRIATSRIRQLYSVSPASATSGTASRQPVEFVLSVQRATLPRESMSRWMITRFDAAQSSGQFAASTDFDRRRQVAQPARCPVRWAS